VVGKYHQTTGGTVMKYSLKKDGITQGLFSQFALCPRAAQFSTQGYVDPGIFKNTAFGSFWHALVEYAIKNEAENIEWFIDNYKFDRRAALDNEEELREIAATLWPAYCEYYSLQHKYYHKRQPEVQFDFLTNSGYRIRGKIDEVFEWANLPVFRETKTKSRIDEDAIKTQINEDFQTLWYSWAIQETRIHYTGDLTLLYDVVRFPQRADVVKDIRKRPEYYFMRYQVSIEKERSREFGNFISDHLYHIEKIMEKSDWPKNLCACNQGFGGCSYAKACKCGDFSTLVKKRKIFEEL
jgi:hypothetical protein